MLLKYNTALVILALDASSAAQGPERMIGLSGISPENLDGLLARVRAGLREPGVGASLWIVPDGSNGDISAALDCLALIDSTPHPSLDAGDRQRLWNSVAPTKPALPRNDWRATGNVLLRRHTQVLVNSTVLFLLIASFVAAGFLALPSATPLGKLIGEISNHRYLLEGVMSGSDPKMMAQAINENPGFLSSVMSELPAGVLAEAINRNPEYTVELAGLLDPKALAVPINENGPLLAKVVNGNESFITELLGSRAGALDPEMISAVISSSSGSQFLVEMLGSLDPGVLTSLFATDAGKALTGDLLAALNENGGADWLAGQLDAGGDANVLRNVLFETESTFKYTTDNGMFTIRIPWLEAAFSGATTTTPDSL